MGDRVVRSRWMLVMSVVVLTTGVELVAQRFINFSGAIEGYDGRPARSGETVMLYGGPSQSNLEWLATSSVISNGLFNGGIIETPKGFVFFRVEVTTSNCRTLCWEGGHVPSGSLDSASKLPVFTPPLAIRIDLLDQYRFHLCSPIQSSQMEGGAQLVQEVEFVDANAELFVRQSLGIYDRSIVQRDLDCVESIEFGARGLTELTLPEGLNRLEAVTMRNAEFADFSFLKELPALRFLGIGNSHELNSLTIPQELSGLVEIRIWDAPGLANFALPKEMPNLTTLSITSASLTDFPATTRMPKLRYLSLQRNQLRNLTIPATMGEIRDIQLGDNNLQSLVFESPLKELIGLSVRNNRLEDFAFLEDFTSLREVDLSGNRLTEIELPEGRSSLVNLTLHSNGLRTFTLPRGMNELQTVLLHSNQLEQLIFLDELPKLRLLDLGSNRVHEFSFLEFVPNLKQLILSHNQLESLPLANPISHAMQIVVSGNPGIDFSFIEKIPNLTGIVAVDSNLRSLTIPAGLPNFNHLEIRPNPRGSVFLPFGLDPSTLNRFSISENRIEHYSPRLRIRGMSSSSPETVEFEITGPIGFYSIESSHDLKNWNEVTSGVLRKWNDVGTVVREGSSDSEFFRVVSLAE